MYILPQWCSTSPWMTSARAPCSTSSCGRVSSSARASRCVCTVRSGTRRAAALAQGYVPNLRRRFDNRQITEKNLNSTAKTKKKKKKTPEYYATGARVLWRHTDFVTVSSSWLCHLFLFCNPHQRRSTRVTTLLTNMRTHRWWTTKSQRKCRNRTCVWPGNPASVWNARCEGFVRQMCADT